MRDIILVRVDEKLAGDASWLRLGEKIEEPVLEVGQLEELAKQASGARVIGLVPSAAVLLTSARIPTTNKQRMIKAIPFALEEELVGDVANLHFAMGSPMDDGRVPVAVVNRQLMEEWQAQFKNAGLTIDVLIPDVFALPYQPDQWSLMVHDGMATMRTGERTGTTFDADNLDFMLPLILKEQNETLPASIELWVDEKSSALSPMDTVDIDVHWHINSGGIFGLVNHHTLNTAKAINLLQGAFSRSEQIGKYLRPWRLAAILLAVLFVMALVTAITESSRLQTLNQQLMTEKVDIYRSVFPDAKNVPKPRAQMQQALAKLKAGGDGADKDFLALLAESGQVFRTTSGLLLRSVRYKNGVLDVDMELPNLQTLDQLKQSLTRSKSLSVEIQSAASRNNKVQGRIQIKSAGS